MNVIKQRKRSQSPKAAKNFSHINVGDKHENTEITSRNEQRDQAKEINFLSWDFQQMSSENVNHKAEVKNEGQVASNFNAQSNLVPSFVESF